jgi:hypothetical protein
MLSQYIFLDTSDGSTAICEKQFTAPHIAEPRLEQAFRAKVAALCERNSCAGSAKGGE